MSVKVSVGPTNRRGDLPLTTLAAPVLPFATVPQGMTGVTAMTLARVAMMTALVLAAGPAMAQLAPQEADTPRRPGVCTEQYLPVCGRLNSVVKTYPNQCYARAAGAEVIAQGPCSGGVDPPGPRSPIARP
jgi:hypothetical protein